MLPDLQTLPPYDLYIQLWDTGERVFRFSNSIINRGPGILELHGQSDPKTERTLVTQRVYKIDETVESHSAGEFVFHPDHHHFHLENFADYEIWSVTPEGDLDAVLVQSDKVSYCIQDETKDQEPGGAEQRRFSNCEEDVQGMSVGWIDTYEHDTPGQWLVISDLPDGLYALRSVVDPQDQLLEADNSNNAAVVYFDLRGDSLEVVDAATVTTRSGR